MRHRFGTANQSNRDAWIRAKLASITPGLRILDVGAGECPYRKDCAHLDYVSQDLALYNGSGDATGLQTGSWDTDHIDLRCDILDIKEPDGSFDIVLCTEVIEHVPDPPAVLEVLARLVKPNGRILLTAPFASLTHFAPYFYCTGFSRYFYEHHLNRLGLKPIEITANGDYFEYLAQELRRIPETAKRFSRARINILDQLVMAYLRRRLERIHQGQDAAQSSELLCFGLHIDALKVPEGS
jgi:SAM-dependent methyltransferase